MIGAQQLRQIIREELAILISEQKVVPARKSWKLLADGFNFSSKAPLGDTNFIIELCKEKISPLFSEYLRTHRARGSDALNGFFEMLEDKFLDGDQMHDSVVNKIVRFTPSMKSYSF